MNRRIMHPSIDRPYLWHTIVLPDNCIPGSVILSPDAGDEGSLEQAVASVKTPEPDIEEMTEEEQLACAIKMSLELEDGSRCFTSGKTE